MDSFEIATIALTLMVLIRVVVAIILDGRGRAFWLVVSLLWALIVVAGAAANSDATINVGSVDVVTCPDRYVDIGGGLCRLEE